MEQIALALGDARGPPRRNPFAVAVGQLGRWLVGAPPPSSWRSATVPTTGERCQLLVVASRDRVDLSPEQKIDVEQAAFLLEGVRNGLDNADLDEAADAIERDIERLDDIVLRYNTGSGRAKG